MLKHIVCWKLKDFAAGALKKENLEKMKDGLDSLPSVITEIVEFEVGININPAGAAFDISLFSSFRDEAALQAYQKHPAHEVVAKFIREVVSERAVVDYLI